jgi:hypothetical protein
MQFFPWNAPPAPPIHVTVQSPPGLSPWITSAISAGIGAVLAIFTNTLMEFIKPMLADRRDRKSVMKQLTAEFLDNLERIDVGIRIFNDEKPKHDLNDTLIVARRIVPDLKYDRYDWNFDKHKAIVYELDDGGLLRNFYGTLKEMAQASKEDHDGRIKILFTAASTFGAMYVESKELQYPSLSMVYDYRMLYEY